MIQGLLLLSVSSGTIAMFANDSVTGVRLFALAFMLGAAALVLAITGKRGVN